MAARSTGATIPSTKAISLGEGYEIGDEVKKERLAGGWRRVGWKLDFTNMGLVAGARRRRKATTALDGPVPALVWLSRLLPDGLRAGDIVTTGSIVAATPVIAGERWTNRLSGPLSSSVEVYTAPISYSNVAGTKFALQRSSKYVGEVALARPLICAPGIGTEP